MSAARWPFLTSLIDQVGEPSSASNPADFPAVRAAYWPYLAIVAGYWTYVTLSNVLYASSLSTGFAAMTTAQLFVTPSVRIVQHAILFPALLLCYLASLRIAWRPLWRTVPLQLLLGIVFGVLTRPALELAHWFVDSGMDAAKDMQDEGSGWLTATNLALWSASATNSILQYGFGLALLTGFTWYRRFRDSEIRIAAIERAWSSARLDALRMQLSPHMLFNLLHVIRGQISWDPRVAQAMVVQLADLLRRLLAAGEREFSRLSDELQFVRLYLELQQRRFADRMTIQLPSEDAVPTAWVPSLILQPLVENAVIHGLAGHEGPVRVCVEVHAQGDMLLLRVTNSIAPMRSMGAAGIGLTNVRERLAVHFGSAAEFTSAPGEASDWVAELRIPLLRERVGARIEAATDSSRP
jgi:hypothetical protein